MDDVSISWTVYQILYHRLHASMLNFICLVPWDCIRKAADIAMTESHSVELEMPWEIESPLTKYLLHDGGVNGKQRFHAFDVWHSLHLGVGKSWAAGAVMKLSKLVAGSNAELRIGVIAHEYRVFCRQKKLDPVIRKIDIHTFGGGGSEEPNGSWNKAAVTSNFLMFLEDFMTRNADMLTTPELRVLVIWPFMMHLLLILSASCTYMCVYTVISSYPIAPMCSQNPRISVYAMCCDCGWTLACTKAKGTAKINEFMRGILQRDVFIEGEDASRLSEALYVFVKAYTYEAAVAFDNDVAAFGLVPKLHALDEIRHTMQRQLATAGYCVNPCIYACSMDEDFIGRTAAVTRCVNPRLLSLRTIQRYLIHIQIAWSRS